MDYEIGETLLKRVLDSFGKKSISNRAEKAKSVIHGFFSLYDLDTAQYLIGETFKYAHSKETGSELAAKYKKAGVNFSDFVKLLLEAVYNLYEPELGQQLLTDSLKFNLHEEENMVQNTKTEMSGSVQSSEQDNNPLSGTPAMMAMTVFNYFSIAEVKANIWELLSYFMTNNDAISSDRRREIMTFGKSLIDTLDGIHALITDEDEDVTIPESTVSVKTDPASKTNVSGYTGESIADEQEIVEKVSIPASEMIQTLFDVTSTERHMINIIVNTVKPDQVYLLDKYRRNEGIQYDLLVLIPDQYPGDMSSYQQLIEKACLEYTQVQATVTVHRTSKIKEVVKEGHFFFTIACLPERLVYCREGIEITAPQLLLVSKIADKVQGDFTKLIQKARAFLDGAAFQLLNEENSVAGFMLHQAAEQALRAITCVLLKYNLITHNLNRLMRFCRRCTPEIDLIFPRNTEEEVALIVELQNAYRDGRYNVEFTMSKENFSKLCARIQKIISLSDSICKQRIDSYLKALDTWKQHCNS